MMCRTIMCRRTLIEEYLPCFCEIFPLCTHLVLLRPAQVIGNPRHNDVPYVLLVNICSGIYVSNAFSVTFFGESSAAAANTLHLQHGRPIRPFAVPCPWRIWCKFQQYRHVTVA